MTIAAPPRPLRDPLGGRVDEQVALQAVLEAQTALGLLRRQPPSLPLASVRGEPPPKVVLAFGLGADSSVMTYLPHCRSWTLDGDQPAVGRDQAC